MSRAAIFAALSPEAKSAVAVALDEISRPLTARQIDLALAKSFTRSQRRPIIRALTAAFDIIAIEPRQ